MGLQSKQVPFGDEKATLLFFLFLEAFWMFTGLSLQQLQSRPC